MSFGNSCIFPFPAVQYIPLAVNVLHTASLAAGIPQAKQPQLLIGPEVEKQRSFLTSQYGIELPQAYPNDGLLLLALNLKIDDVKYRGYFVTMTGQSTPGYYQLAVIPRKYFYKKQLFFELYDFSTSNRLARQSFLL